MTRHRLDGPTGLQHARGVGGHPLNLALRFALELAMLGALGLWGYRRGGAWGWVLAAALPLTAAILWGVFAVPDDPSRSGKTVVATPGVLRLLLELSLFAGAALALWHVRHPILAGSLGATVLVHYALSYDRVAWLWSR